MIEHEQTAFQSEDTIDPPAPTVGALAMRTVEAFASIEIVTLGDAGRSTVNLDENQQRAYTAALSYLTTLFEAEESLIREAASVEIKQ